jgi:gamma-glutamylcyclotransferase (GGCT)/AIG2-like uncharacterized protein YtfP
MLHFAYGSNMSPVVMRRHAPAAQALGVATLANYRFVITMDGYASVRPARAQSVYGVLWRLTSRDRVRLDAWENIAGGLYHAMTLPVHLGSCRRAALVYVARPSGEGRAKSGYMDLVIAAARAWRLPADYVAALQRWRPAHARTSRRKLGDFGWS